MDQLLNIRFLSLFVIAILLIDSYFCTCASAQGISDNSDAIIKLTNTILIKEMELERFYLKYKIVANQEPKLRRLRYFLGQQASLGLFLGGDIVTINETGKNLSTPQNVSAQNLKRAIRVELVGSIIGGASSATEIFSNGLVAWKNKKYKQDPTSAQVHVKILLQEITGLLAKRTELVGQQKVNSAYDIYVTEGTLLQYYRDWCVYEFAKIYADVKSYQSSANVYYLLNTAANSLYSVAGGLAIKSFQSPQFISPSIVTAIVGDSTSIISAPASFLTRKFLYKHHVKKIYKKLEERSYDVEKASLHVLQRLHEDVAYASENTLSQSGPIKTRLTAYDLWNQRYDEYISCEMELLRKYDRNALQSLIFGPLISGTFLAQDLLGASAYYGNSRRPRTANNLVFSGAITAGVGAVTGLGATSWYFIDETLNERKFRAQGKLPEQLVQKRLQTLDEIEVILARQSR